MFFFFFFFFFSRQLVEGMMIRWPGFCFGFDVHISGVSRAEGIHLMEHNNVFLAECSLCPDRHC